MAVEAGASFVVSPGLSHAVVDRCRHHGVLPIPGAVTATEIQAALEVGLTTVKFFPAATSGGADAIAALAAPFPDVRFMPTGGVGPADLPRYLRLSTVTAVGGSWMVPTDLLRTEDFDAVAVLTADTRAKVEELMRSAPAPAPSQHTNRHT